MISIIDSTYREGRQSALANILPVNMVRFAKLLDAIGIEYMEIAYPFTAEKYLNQFRKLIRADLNLNVSVHSALNIDNFKKIIKEGIYSINVSLKINQLKRPTINKQIRLLREIIDECGIQFDYKLNLRVGIEYAFSMPCELLIDLCEKISNFDSVRRICLSDTDGSATPEYLRRILIRIDKKLTKGKTLELHFHNDCGLAAANFNEAYGISKISNREIAIDVSVGGIGERNGILSIGDVFAILYCKDGELLKRKYNLFLYKELYDSIYHRCLFNRDPLNCQSFYHASGLHIASFLKSGKYQNINPEIFGQNTRFIFNESINSEAIIMLAKLIFNIEIAPKKASEIAVFIRKISSSSKRNIGERRVVSVIRDMIEKK